jgi:hypothetical protein
MLKLTTLPQEKRKLIDYYNLSYKGGREFVEGIDNQGNRILIKHECEEPRDYQNRINYTPSRSYVSAVLNNFLSGIYRVTPSRPENFEDIIENADGKGHSLDWVVSSALKNCMIGGIGFLKVNSQSVNNLSMAQIQNIPVTIQNIPIESVLDYTIEDDILINITIIYEGNEFENWKDGVKTSGVYDPKTFNVLKITEETEYTIIPVVPLSDELPVVSLIIDNVRSILNTISNLKTEEIDSVFTRFLISGVRPPENSRESSIAWSGKRLLFVEDQGVSVNRIGSDTTQSDALMKSIQSDVDDIIRVTGCFLDGKGVSASSGVALRIQKETYSLNCEKYAKIAQYAENLLFYILGEILARPVTTSVLYSDNFLMPDYSEEILQLRDILSLPLSDETKQKAVERFEQLYFR